MKKIFITAVLCFFSALLFAQPLCGFDGMYRKMLGNDEQYRAAVKANNERIKDYIRQHPLGTQNNTGVLYTIPVVIHVVHTGGAIGTAYNPTDAQLIAALDYVNKIYNGTDASLSGGVGDLQIQFVLAKRDPNCNPTTGINRIDGSSIPLYTNYGVNYKNSNGTPEISVKNLIRWDPSNYYNIWVVNKIDGLDGTTGQYMAGYAYYPGGLPQYDGTVILASQIKSGKKTFPHELAHAFNLYHPFEGSAGVNFCPSNDDCSVEGDMVCDTDPITYNSIDGTTVNFTCRTGINPCTGTNYNINTENNFMNYTSCYTLFTAGQKERLLAAMSLPDRITLTQSLGGQPVSGGTNPCRTLINFQTAQLTVSETTTGTDGCRNYTDYTISMAIDAAPSAIATVNLQLGGTATNNADYIISTNGNFSTSSTQLTFPVGSSNSQSFVLRIYDDVSIETQETIVIDFTVDGGGGNAIKGITTTTFNVKLNDNDAAPLPYGIGNATVGSNSRGDFYHPFRGNFQRARTQAIYLASELQALGLSSGSTISKIALRVNSKSSTVPYTNFNVNMKNTALSDFTVAVFETGLTNVYTGNYSTVAGVNTIVLNTPFVWDGVSNIVIDFCYDNTTNAAANDIVNSTFTEVSRCIWNRDNTGEGCLLTAYYSSVTGVGYLRPDITFSAQFGTPVATALNTSKTEYLGPYADVYYKDSNNKVIARIKNLTAFDYGCTTVEIDRAGTQALPFWSNNTSNYLAEKTIKVTPTNNNSEGLYEITLYYSEAEIFGWQTATAQNFGSVQIIKTEVPISIVSPANIKSAIPVSIVTGDTTAFGNDRSVTGTFNTGFSCFGVGILVSNKYVFTGNGNWSDNANWYNNVIPPAILPSGSQVIIDPVSDGECILNVQQTISSGAILDVQQGKKLRITGNLQLQ